MSTMTRRLQILLEEPRYELLERESQRTGRSIAELIRDSVDAVYGLDKAARRDALESIQAEKPMPVEETLHQRAGRTGDRESALRVARNIMTLRPVHDLTNADVALGLRLYGTCTRLNVRDVLHAAIAFNRSIPMMVSPDQAFDDVPQLERVDPVQAVARL